MKTKGKPNEMDIEIGKNLKKIRKLRKISQNTLGIRIKVSFQQIQKYESGQNRISASRLALLSEALDEPIISFYPKRYQYIWIDHLKRLLNDMA